MVVPCSMHSIFKNPLYVPFGDILKRDYHVGEWVEVDGICERIERIAEVDVLSFAEKYEGYLSVEQVARDFFVSTDTVNGWIKRGRIRPTASFVFGSKRVNLFSPEDVSAIRRELDIPVHDDETLSDSKFVKRSMLVNPFEKFERKRFMYYSKDLGVISLNHALLSKLSTDDFMAVQKQMLDDLKDYYSKLEEG